MNAQITPLIRPVRPQHTVRSGFGLRVDPLTGKPGQFHNGIDYTSDAGPEVLAICDGIVWFDHDNYDERYRWDFTSPNSGGRMIVVQHIIHGVKRFAGYLHLVENYVSVGQAVKQGQLLGKYGNVGASTGPHLHFMIKSADNAVENPEPIMIEGLKASGLLV